MRFVRHKTHTFQNGGSIGLLDRILCPCSHFCVIRCPISTLVQSMNFCADEEVNSICQWVLDFAIVQPYLRFAAAGQPRELPLPISRCLDKNLLPELANVRC